jgi:hypothetical protein
MWYVLFPTLLLRVEKDGMLHFAIVKKGCLLPLAEVNDSPTPQASARRSSVLQLKQHTVVHSLANGAKERDFVDL